jgi:hypothetical protein
MKEIKLFDIWFETIEDILSFCVPLNFGVHPRHFDTSMQDNIEHLCSLSLQLQFIRIQQNINLIIEKYKKKH